MCIGLFPCMLDLMKGNWGRKCRPTAKEGSQAGGMKRKRDVAGWLELTAWQTGNKAAAVPEFLSKVIRPTCKSSTRWFGKERAEVLTPRHTRK